MLPRSLLSVSVAAAATKASSAVLAPSYIFRCYRGIEASHLSAALLTPLVIGLRLRSCLSSEPNNRGSDSSPTPRTSAMESSCPNNDAYDVEYPGTAVTRMNAIRERVSQLASSDKLNGPWEGVRKELLWAGGLRDLPKAVPGQGYTGHSFNDYNHVDLTAMNDEVSDNRNDGSVKGIAIGNRLGPGVKIASIPDLGPGGSWSTCAIGCNSDPPQDVAHVQFRSRIAFKLVWVPNDNYDTFVLIDDAGKLLATGKPSDGPAALPPLRERMMNYKIMAGSKYAREADALAGGAAAE